MLTISHNSHSVLSITVWPDSGNVVCIVQNQTDTEHCLSSSFIFQLALSPERPKKWGSPASQLTYVCRCLQLWRPGLDFVYGQGRGKHTEMKGCVLSMMRPFHASRNGGLVLLRWRFERVSPPWPMGSVSGIDQTASSGDWSLRDGWSGGVGWWSIFQGTSLQRVQTVSWVCHTSNSPLEGNLPPCW